ncbi:MAG TPA: hypothetical protein VMU51_33700 [Mycobacteriales bacterium]|nr:hypothetical protein [Mycobacteriales bacterium]
MPDAARWARPATGPGWRGRWARRRLTRAALAGDPAAVEALCALAVDRDELARVCVEHRLVPADPTRRAVFLLLTGQPEQYEAADPDGSLLAAGYPGQRPVRRERLRGAVLALGRLDLIQRVAGSRGRTPDETGWLAEQLVARADWPALWKLLRAVPLRQAVGLAREFPPGWQPPGADRPSAADAGGLLAALLRVRPSEVVPSLAATVDVRLLSRVPAGISISPDGTELAVLAHDGYAGAPGTLTLGTYPLCRPGPAALGRAGQPDRPILEPAGRLELRVPRTVGMSMLHAGAAVLMLVPDGPRLVEDAGGGAPGRGERPRARLLRVTGGQVTELAGVAEPASGLVPTPTGFAVASGNTLDLHDATGALARTVAFADLVPAGDRLWGASLSAEPGAGLLAIGGNELLLLDGDGAVLARAPSPDPMTTPRGAVDLYRTAFAGPDRILSFGQRSHRLISWRRDGDRLRPEAEQELSMRSLTVLPALGLVALRSALDTRWYTVDGLRPVNVPPGLPADWHPLATPDGGWAGSRHRDLLAILPVEPLTWLTSLVDRDPAGLTAADARRLVAVEHQTRTATLRPLLALLNAWLAERFGAEIVLADPGRRPAGSDTDIALADPD